MRKIRFYKLLLAEICETLCTICFDNVHNSMRPSTMKANYMSHFYKLKEYSSKLRGNEENNDKDDKFKL